MVYMGSADAELSAEDKKPIVDITVEHVMDKINRKEWKPSTKIPTGFELVETLKVSRSSMREVIKVLIALGLLEIRRADGTYVASRFSEKMMTPWACSLLLEDDDSLALLELRMVIKRGVLSLAIQKGIEEGMRTIYDASEHFTVLVQDVQATSSEILDADIRYRRKICEAPHNHPTARLDDTIASVSLHSCEKSTEEVIACNDCFHMVGSHRKLTEIIVQRRTADLSEMLSYCHRYWGIAPQNQKQKNGRLTA